MPHIQAGKLRALAVTPATRAEVLPNLPTVGELVPVYEASTWNGVCAPKSTPAEIVGRHNREIDAGLATKANDSPYSNIFAAICLAIASPWLLSE